MPIVLLVGQLLLQYGPAVAQAFTKLFSSTTPPTDADWDAILTLARTPWKDRQPDVVLPLPPVGSLSSLAVGGSSSSSH